MAELLEYNFAVVGMANVERALASLERRFAMHNSRMQREFGGSVRGGRAADRVGSASGAVEALQRQRSAALYAQVRKEESLKIASERRIFAEKANQQRRFARIQVQEETAAARKVAREAKQFRESTIGNAYGRVAGVAASVGKRGMQLAGVAGAGLAATSISQAMSLEDKSRRLALSARGAGEKFAYSPAELQKRANSTSIATGVDTGAILDATQGFVAKTGDIKTGVENMKVFATVAQATGASIEDVASTAADLSQKFDIKGPKEMGDALAVLAFQGKKGAFELRDMATTFPEMAAAAQRAGLTGVKGMRTLGGLAQIARQSTGSGEEASTSLQNAMTQLQDKSSELHSGKALAGRTVDVFQGGDATKAARDLPTVLAEVISRSHGNIEQLNKIFDKRGMKAVSPMITAARDAMAGTKGTAAQKEAAGAAAVLKMIDDASNASGSFKDVETDAAEAMKSVNVQMEVLYTQLRATVASEIFPELVRLAPRVAELVPIVGRITRGLVDMAEVAAHNPFSTLGATVGALIGTEIIKAELGAILARGIESKLATGGLVVGTIVGTIALAKLYVESLYQEAAKKVSAATASGNEVRAQASKELDITGAISPETKAKLVALNEQESNTITAGDKALQEGSTYGGIIKRGYQSLTGGKHDLQEMATLQRATASPEYREGHLETERLLAISDSLEKGGKAAADAMKAGAEEAAKTLAGGTPNRGNAPSPVKN